MEPLNPYRSMAAPPAAPPRHIPWTVRVPLLCGGSVSWMGWLLLLACSFSVSSFAPHLGDALAIWRAPASAPAVVVAVRVDSAIGRKPCPTRWAIDFTFAVDGSSHRGTSYACEQPPSIAAALTAEFPRGRPDRARLRGMSRFKDNTSQMPLLLLAIGIAILVVTTLPGRRALVLLSRGAVANGRLVDRAKTEVAINRQTVYRYTFEFESADGSKHHAVARTSLTHAFHEGRAEQVLYLPDNPDVATLLEHLPLKPRVRDAGTVEPRPAGWAVAYLLAVGAIVAINVGTIVVVLR